MKISDLKVGQGKVEVEASVKELGEVRSFNKFGRELKVANAIIGDDSGEIKLTLWNDDIDRVKPGSKIKIINGYVNEFQGEKQLTTGKFGSLEVEESEAGEEKGEAREEAEDVEEAEVEDEEEAESEAEDEAEEKKEAEQEELDIAEEKVE